MAVVGVWSEGGWLFRQITSDAPRTCRVLWASHPSAFVPDPPELLIIAPDAKALAGAGAIASPMALLPGGHPPLGRAVRALSAVSYGAGAKNTLTFSSLTENRLSLALQRDIVPLPGGRVDPQEWPLPFPRGRVSPEEFLCYQGARLLLGLEPAPLPPDFLPHG